MVRGTSSKNTFYSSCTSIACHFVLHFSETVLFGADDGGSREYSYD